MSMSTNRASWAIAVSLSRVLLGGLLIVMITALSAGCRGSTEAASEPPPAVEVQPVVAKDVSIHGEWVGTTVGYVTCPSPKSGRTRSAALRSVNRSPKNARLGGRLKGGGTGIVRPGVLASPQES